jgi:large subunit ribosomal protein L22
MPYKYAFKDYDKESMSRCVLTSASVSTKHCIEIASSIRGRSVQKAIIILEEAIALKKAIPFNRFKRNIGHKKNIGPGRYVIKACGEVLTALKQCEANAQNKGLNTSDLKVIHVNANLASRPWHYGRQSRRKMKKSHIEIVLQEVSKKAPAKPEVKIEKAPVKEAEKQPIVKEDKVQEAPAPVETKAEEKKADKKPAARKPKAKKVAKDEPKEDTGSKD